jgi:hypothetical protein
MVPAAKAARSGDRGFKVLIFPDHCHLLVVFISGKLPGFPISFVSSAIEVWLS